MPNCNQATYDDVAEQGALHCEQVQQITPEVGMGVTYLCGSDRYPYTIIKVNTPRKLTIREDNTGYKRIARDAKPRAIRLHKSGHWFDTDGMQYRVGDRESYLDPSF